MPCPGRFASRSLKPVLGLAAALLLLTAGCMRQPKELRLLEPTLPVDREIARDLVKILAEESTFRIHLVPADAKVDTALDAVEAGQVDLAFVSNAQDYRQGVATVMPLYPTVLHIAYRTDKGPVTDPRTLLQDATVFAGERGSSSRLLMERVLASLRLPESSVTFVDDLEQVPDIVVLYAPIDPDALREFAAGHGGLVGYRLLSLGTPADIGTGGDIDRAILLHPQLSAFIIPAGTYDALTPEPVVTLAVDKLLVARSDLSPTLVYDLIDEVLRLRPALAAKRPTVFRRLQGDYDTASSVFVLHQGAQNYLQRDMPDIYERYSGVAEVAVTIFVTLVSAVAAGIRLYRMRRKNRIDTYYANAMAIQDSIRTDSTDKERIAAAEKLRLLQRSAFQALIDEKLAADESFRIFITLSNDIIDGFQR